VKACPFGAIAVCRRKAVIAYDRCTFCGACVAACRKFKAIERDESAHEGVVAHRDVWVIAETGADGGLARVSRELLGVARGLADALGVSVAAVLIGENLGGAAAQAIAAGADRVHLAEHPGLRVFLDEPQAAVVADLIRREQPEIVLGGATARGRALLPRVAVLVRTGLTADCTRLAIDVGSGRLLQTRPAFGGNLLATIVCEERRPQMATVRPGVFPVPVADPGRRGVVSRVDVPPARLASGVEWLDVRGREAQGEDLHAARVVVTAGRGVGGPDGVRLVASLAAALGGTLGASRSVVDAGWVEYGRQVGQTGVTVQPAVYIACGVSGAIQHVVGMQNSGTVVAINRDPSAPIFAQADIGIVGDVFEVVPALIEQLGNRAARLEPTGGGAAS